MDDVFILGRGTDDWLLKSFAARYDVPAYVRRARRVQEALDDLIARCRKQREEWLAMVRLYARAVLALAGGRADEELTKIRLALELSVQESLPASDRKFSRALRELNESTERFNVRWQRFVSEVDLGPVNKLREDYNRYYVLEKECALRSARLARLGFQPLPAVTIDDLLALLPLLPLLPRGS